jgi:hypothetical protein
MLFTQSALAGLESGTITVAFRRWKRARVRAGSRLRTSVGVVGIEAIDVVDPDRITEREARQAGFDSRTALVRELDRRGEGATYRIRLRVIGPDPRLALRDHDQLTDEELAAVLDKLSRLDRASRHGPWTAQVLRLIASRPATRAADLAATVGRERLAFKRDVRKLKELGLTESLDVGYRLSPRGRTVLERLA